MMYKDMLNKVETYKNEIIKLCIKDGIYPTQDKIATQLAKIDAKHSYLKVQLAIVGKPFDCEAYNAMIYSIYKDLELLYKLLQEWSINQYASLESYAQTHLTALEQKVDFYISKSQEETATTSLGKTIGFFMPPFNFSKEDQVYQKSLGTISCTEGSKIYVLVNGENIKTNSLYFEFSHLENTHKVLPYNSYADSYFKVPGQLKINYYIQQLNQNNVYSLPSFSLEPKKDASYTILAGKHEVALQTNTYPSIVYKKAPTYQNGIYFEEDTYIDFYTLDTKSISFRFSKPPLRTNFKVSTEPLLLTNKLNHFYLLMPKGSILECFIDKGEIYAQKQQGIVKDNILFYPKLTPSIDFCVIETENGTKKDYQVSCLIDTLNKDFVEIKNILIKEKTVD